MLSAHGAMYEGWAVAAGVSCSCTVYSCWQATSVSALSRCFMHRVKFVGSVYRVVHVLMQHASVGVQCCRGACSYLCAASAAKHISCQRTNSWLTRSASDCYNVSGLLRLQVGTK